MIFWQRWVSQPQNLWLRKALFQVHLWTGIGLGLYVVIVCVTGSAVVFNNELSKKFARKPPIFAATGEVLAQEVLKDDAKRAFPDYSVSQFFRARNPSQAVEIWLERDGVTKQRLFQPYTGEDLGDAVAPGLRMISWLTDLHKNFLKGDTGRIVNGVGSILLTLLCLTGAVVWWPGVRSWRRGLTIQWQSNWKRVNWDLHSAVGFWTFLVVFMFALSGDYLIFPEPFSAVLDPHPADQFNPADFQTESPGGFTLRWLARLHFGRFGGWPVKALWVVLGLVPVFLLITGTLMWWNRVIRSGSRQSEQPAAD